MITIPTALILGAGASIPVGFTSGQELTNEIIEKSIETESLGRFLRKTFSSKENKINKFRDDLFHACQPSIDRFLQGRPEYAEIGKAAIAFVIVQREKIGCLSRRVGDNWYHKLFHELTSDGFDSFANNKLQIITFNYDRSLEQYFFQALRASYNKSQTETAKVITAIPIVHVYGSVGPLPWRETRSLEFDPHSYSPKEEKDWEIIWKAAESIRVIPERLSDGTEEQISVHLRSSRRIHFLGFGFEQENFKSLKINWHSEPKDKYFGTSYGIGIVATNTLQEHSRGKLTLYPKMIHDYFHAEQQL